MIQTKEIELETSKGRAVFEVPQLDGVRAVKLFVRLTNKAGPAIAMLKSGGAAAALGAFLEHLEPDEYERIQNELLARVSCRWPEGDDTDSNAVRNLGTIFTGHPFELGRLVLFALEANYGSFFERLRDAVTKALAETATVKKS
jgi:hypothetical protein